MPIRPCLVLLLLAPAFGAAPGWDPRPGLARIQAEATANERAYANLQWLCDRIGHRLAGSKGLEAAVAWSRDEMRREGFQNVRTEKVMVPRWERGPEKAEMLVPVRKPLRVLALGGSVSTPQGGLEADLVKVGSLAELEGLPEGAARGRIVLFQAPWKGYGEYSEVRVKGASAAARKGALAMLLGAHAPRTLDTPHTGVLHYDEKVPRIPAAGISLEAATQMQRLLDGGATVRVRLDLQSREYPDAESANVVGELRGGEKPEEIVVVGGHLDSWDVGQGAQDDGVGCMLAMEAAQLIHRAGLKPRRTIRVVFFTNEENGSRGGAAYLEAHRAELDRHAGAIESDIGNGLIQGFSLDVRALQGDEARKQRAKEMVQGLMEHLKPLGAGRLSSGWSGVDIGPTVAAGVPGFGAGHDTTRYWDVHHTEADTFDKIDKQDLRKNLAILASMLYLLADMPERL
ncbi:MAG: M20/M25/M40 family metallo-hydrolase [Acidobacteria bacterium]|nr:M20/M25/M40 family metallo-hydrolase [Acidobacteriota bacterium]